MNRDTFHPVQLERVWTDSVSTKQIWNAHSEHDAEQLRLTEDDLTVECSVHEFLSDGAFVVRFYASMGNSISDPVYQWECTIMGQFRIQAELFDQHQVNVWARTNAYYLLLPFVRELVFALTIRLPSGPYIVPLITIPIESANV